jgi:hypothetical protein
MSDNSDRRTLSEIPEDSLRAEKFHQIHYYAWITEKPLAVARRARGAGRGRSARRVLD